MSWLYLITAIIFEVSGTTSMKLSQGFSRTLPSVMIFVLYAVSFCFLTLALKKIEVSIAYAIWSGIGTALIGAIGILWFRESLTLMKMISLALIIAGVIGLHMSSGTGQ